MAQEKLSPGPWWVGGTSNPGGPDLAVGSSGASHQCVALQVQLPDAPPGRGPCGANSVALIEMPPCQLGFFLKKCITIPNWHPH